MLTVVNILIGFFIFLILYQVILASNIVEGLENQYSQYENNPNNTLILAQKNAGNIEYLKQRVDKVQGMYDQVQDLSGNVGALQTQLNGLVQAQQDYANQMTGGTAPEISGAIDPDDNEDEDEDIGNLVTE
jgi:P-type conjugative transfer protein TrbJ